MSNPETQALRDKLADQLIADRAEIGQILTEPIAQAVRTVPRHLFLPGVDVETAYTNHAAPIMKRDAEGVAISSVSAPFIQVMQLTQADIQPGMNVLEIGSGGYNAGLIAELVGEKGQVTTLDIDSDVTDRAEAGLKAAGYDQVRVVCADGEYGFAEGGPYDRIIVTVGAPDIPAAWVDQLAPNGILVVPLRVRGLTRSFALMDIGDSLECTVYELCGFVPIQGVGENRQRLVPLIPDAVALRVDDNQPADAAALALAMAGPKVEAWSGVTVGGMEPWDDLDLWIATVSTNYAFLTATNAAIDDKVADPALRWGSSCIYDADSFAYHTMRQVDPDSFENFEFGVYAHGPNADELAERLKQHIVSWDRTYRNGPKPDIHVYPKSALDADVRPADLIVEKRASRVTVSWP